MKKLKSWLESFRLSVTIPAGLLVIGGAKLAHRKIDWLLVIEIFFIASIAMIHNDYYDRENDLKKGRRFAYENQSEVRKVVIVGWSVVWIIAIFLYKYWITLYPVISISMIYSYTRKIMYLQTFCVALTSASPLLIGHLGIVRHGELKFNFILFFITFGSIYAREMIKNIEDAETDVGWKVTPISTGKLQIFEYLDLPGAIAYGCLGALFYCWKNLHGNIPMQAEIFFGMSAILYAGTLFWQNPDAMLGPVPRYRERSDIEAKKDADIGKRFFDLSMFALIISMLLM